MSRLTSLIRLMDDPENDGFTRFLVNSDYAFAGINSSNKLFYITKESNGRTNRIFVTHEQIHDRLYEVSQCLA